MYRQLNEAECIIEYFWDKCIFDRKGWRIEGLSFKEEITPESIYSKVEDECGKGFKIGRTWCGFRYEIEPDNDFYMEKSFDIGCADYSSIVLCCELPKGVSIGILAVCDEKTFSNEFENHTDFSNEFSLPITGKKLKVLRISLKNSSLEVKEGVFRFLILRNDSKLRKCEESKLLPDKKWEPFLKEEDFEPEFVPWNEYIMTAEETEELRGKIGKAQIEKIADLCRKMPEPERYYKAYTGGIENYRFTATRDYDNQLMKNGQLIALFGLLSKDDELSRKGVRYALTIALCPYWLESFICNVPGTMFEHKAFATAICCEEIVSIMELCGEYLTPVGREFLLRRLAEAGLGHINWIVWKYSDGEENIFDMNQLAWFSRGRVPAYIMLSRFWGRCEEYLRLAYEELYESVNNLILPDGGYPESIGYLVSVAHFSGMAFYKYAKFRNLPFDEVMPSVLKKTADYVECFVSFDKSIDYIPVGDAHANVSPVRFAVLAALMPESHWTTLFRRAWNRQNGVTDDVSTLILESRIPKEEYKEYKSFISLPHCGVVSSLRKYQGEYMKFLTCGGKAHARHQHPDKGAFVLQYAGETIVSDPGIGGYAHLVGGKMGGPTWHTVLIPSNGGKSYRQSDLEVDLIPEVRELEEGFWIKYNLADVWNGEFESYTRVIHSCSPEDLEVRDKYVLTKANRVVFQIITALNAVYDGDELYIEGDWTKTEILFENDCTVKIEEKPQFEGVTYKRIMIEKEGREGEISVRFRLGLK